VNGVYGMTVTPCVIFEFSNRQHAIRLAGKLVKSRINVFPARRPRGHGASRKVRNSGKKAELINLDQPNLQSVHQSAAALQRKWGCCTLGAEGRGFHR
jgi:hypothetical protein